MKSFLLMLGFFTRLPVPNIEFTEERYSKAIKLMPLIGLVIGVILTGILFIAFALNIPGLIRGAILLCAYIFLTGGLHFDGLADTCDGVLSGRTREQSLEIMKDSRIGVFGTLGIFIAGLFYFVLFSDVMAQALFVFPLCGRACCLISASLAPYAREEGMGKATGMAGGPATVAAAVLFIVGASFLTIIPIFASEKSFFFPVICSLIASGAAILVTACMTMNFKKKLGGVTGDTFGSIIEVSSLVFLLIYFVAFRMLPL